MIPKIERSQNHPKSRSKIWGPNKNDPQNREPTKMIRQNGDPTKMIQNGDLKHQTPLPIKLPPRL